MITPEVDLEHLDDEWLLTESAYGSGRVPDGGYHCRVDNALITRNRSGDPILSWELLVDLPSEHRGKLLYRTNGLVSGRLGWLRADLECCGIHLERLSDLRERVGDLIGLQLVIAVKTNGKYQNVYIQQLAPSDGPTDNIPF